MSEVCEAHQELAISITEMHGKLDNLNEKMEVFQDHMKDSVPVRDDVRDNTKFRRNGILAIRVLYAATVGVVLKLLFIN